jgi:HPt (histidine-containing phosphotransfer) domain-containing protein
MINSHAIDQDAIDRLLEWGGDKLLVQLLRLFLDNTPERFQQIENGLAPGGDLDEAHRGAHSLKSSAGNVGAMEVSELAAQLESATKTSDIEASQELYGQLRAAYAEAEAVLRGILEGASA